MIFQGQDMPATLQVPTNGLFMVWKNTQDSFMKGTWVAYTSKPLKLILTNNMMCLKFLIYHPYSIKKDFNIVNQHTSLD